MVPDFLKNLVSRFDGLFELLRLILGLAGAVSGYYVTVRCILTSRVLKSAASFAGKGVGFCGGIGRVQLWSSPHYPSLNPADSLLIFLLLPGTITAFRNI